MALKDIKDAARIVALYPDDKETVEPILDDFTNGADGEATIRRLATLSSIPGTRVEDWPESNQPRPLKPYYLVGLRNGERIYIEMALTERRWFLKCTESA